MHPLNYVEKIVAGSHGGRITKWRGKVASIAPGIFFAAMAVAGLAASPAASQVISGAVTTEQDVAADGDLTVTSSGSVAVTETNTATAIDVAAGYTGALINQGVINATAQAASGSAMATALSFQGDVGTIDGAIVSSGSILNSGMISATAIGGTSGTDASVTARGIHIQGGMTAGSDFTGTGNITVNAMGGDAESNTEAVRTSVEDTYSIFVNGWVSNGSFFSQSGDVSLTAVGGSGQVDGSFSANTRINEVAGIRIGRVRDSTIELSGDVGVSVYAGASASQDYSDSSVKEVAGVWFYDAIENQSSVLNSGNITVIGQAGDGAGDGSASLQVEDVGAIIVRGNVSTSEFENRGDLSVAVKGGAEAVGSKGRKNTDVENAAGILFDRSNISNGSNLRNSGDISVRAESGATTGNARVRYIGGIQFFDGNIDTGAALNNSGAISVQARAAAGGIRANTQTVAGISLMADGGKGVFQGRVVDGQVDYAELVNSGNITVAAHAGKSTGLDGFDSADASALNTAGILIGRALSGNLINSGDFNVSSSGGTANGGIDGNANADASAFGVRVAGNVESTSIQPNTGSTFSNSGNMVVTAKGGVAQASGAGEAAASASAYGVSITGTITEDSSFVNSGDITALATAGSATGSTTTQDAKAYAAYVGSITKTQIEEGDFTGVVTTGTFTSTGHLTGRVYGDSGIGAGFWVNGDMDGRVDLQGWIRGVGAGQSAVGPDRDSYAVYLGSGNGDLNISAPTWFVGALKIADQSVSLTSGDYHSVHWVFDYGEGADFTLIEGDGVPWFSRNGDTQSGEYATYDTSGQVLQDQTIAEIVGFGDRQMWRNLRSDSDVAHPRVWLELDGATSEFSGQYAAMDGFDITTTGGVGGITWQTGHNLSFGLMGGAVASDASGDDSGQSIDANTLLFGAGAAAELNGFMLDGGVKLGSTSMDGSRLVNYNLAVPQDGAEYAESDVDAKWARVALGASYAYEIGLGVTITPAAYLSYTKAKIDEYDESGDTANASVDSRDVGITEFEVGVDLSKEIGAGLISGSLGYVSRSTDGLDSVDVTLIGDEQSVGLETADFGATKLGLGYSYKVGENLIFDVEGGILMGEDWQSQNLSASATLRF